MQRVAAIIGWVLGLMMAAQIIFNIGDLLLGYIRLPKPVGAFVTECWPLLFFAAPVSGFVLGARGILPGTEETGKNAHHRFWIYVIITSVIIHALFCAESFTPLRQGGMAIEGPWLLVFWPQYILVLFDPPNYPVDYNKGVVSVNYFHFWGKMLVAFPASLLYAFLLVSGGSLLVASLKAKDRS